MCCQILILSKGMSANNTVMLIPKSKLVVFVNFSGREALGLVMIQGVRYSIKNYVIIKIKYEYSLRNYLKINLQKLLDIWNL